MLTSHVLVKKRKEIKISLKTTTSKQTKNNANYTLKQKQNKNLCKELSSTGGRFAVAANLYRVTALSFVVEEGQCIMIQTLVDWMQCVRSVAGHTNLYQELSGTSGCCSRGPIVSCCSCVLGVVEEDQDLMIET